MEQVRGILVMTLITMNVVIFGVDNSLSSHTDNIKNNFLILDKGPTDDINIR